MKILTGIDIPFLPSSGSPIVCNDWYSNLPPDIEVRFLALPPKSEVFSEWWSIKDTILLDVEKKKSVKDFPEYVEVLKQEVQKQIQSFQPDAIHCQHLNFGLSMAMAKLENCHIPKIGICHGTDVQLATKSKFFLENMKFIRKKMDLLVFPTQNMADDYFKYDACQKDYVVVSHGIPDEAYSKFFSMSSPKWKTQPFKILYAGRLTSFKGADKIVSAMKYLPDGIHLTVMGNEDERGYKEKLLRAVKTNNLHSKVSFVPPVTRQELWKEFSDFQLIVFPSTELECFSLTAIEAQAQGLVVAYHKNAGGIENVIKDSGIKIPNNTPQEWAEKIKAIYYEPSILSKYRNLGYENSQKYKLSARKDDFFQVNRDFLSLSNHNVQRKTDFLEAGRRFANIYQKEQKKWSSGDVIATTMENGSIVPINYCLSTIARIKEQNECPISEIEMIRNKLLQAASQQFFYPLESLHISLQGCTERLPSPDHFSYERIQKIQQVCDEVFSEVAKIDILLRGVNILGPQVFIQAFPCDNQWAELREQLEEKMLQINEKPITYPDKKPIHMNLVRITDNSQGSLDQLFSVVEELRNVEIGEFQVSVIEFLMTDFVVSPKEIKVFKKFHLF